MRELFADILHLMAELATPWPRGKPRPQEDPHASRANQPELYGHELTIGRGSI
jgi:hypothetical protein